MVSPCWVGLVKAGKTLERGWLVGLLLGARRVELVVVCGGGVDVVR